MARGELRAERVGQTELNTHKLVHPVVSCELRTVGRENIFAVAVILPDNGLHMTAEVAVILGCILGVIKVNTEHFTEVAGISLSFRLDILVCGFECLALDAGAGAGLALAKGIAVGGTQGDFLKTVGSAVYCGNCRVGIQIVFTETALKRFAVLGNSVVLAEFSEIVRLYLDRNVLDAGDVVGGNADFVLVVGLAVCIDKVVAVRPRNRVIILVMVLGVDNNALLEAAAMQTVVARCAGNRIERALVVFVVAVEGIGPIIPLAVLVQVNTLALPVFVIRNSGVSVNVLREGYGKHLIFVVVCLDGNAVAAVLRHIRERLGGQIQIAVRIDNRHRVLAGCGVFLVANLNRGDIFQIVCKSCVICLVCRFERNRLSVILRRRLIGGNGETCRYVRVLALRVGNRYLIRTRQSGTEGDGFRFFVIAHAFRYANALREIVRETGEGERSALCVCIELCNFGLCALCDVRNMQLFRQIELDYAVFGVVGDCADVLAYEGGVSLEAKLGYMPDFGYVVQTVGVAVRGGQDNGVNLLVLLGLLDFVAFDLHFVLGVLAGSLEFGNGCGTLGRRTGRLAERPLAVGQGRFLVVRRGGAQDVVGVACAFKQRFPAGIGGGFILVFFVFYRDAYGVAVCYLLEAGKVARLYANRIGNAGNIRAVAIDMIRTACQRTVAGLIQGRRRNRVNGRCIFAQFRLIELVIRNIHQHIAVIAAGRAAAAGGRAAARRSRADGFSLAGFYGLIARLDTGNAVCRHYLGVLGRNRNVVRVGLYVRYLAVARYLGACRRYGDSADGCVLFDGQGSLIGNSNIAYRAGQGQIGLRGHSADAAARYRDRRRAVRAADQHALAGRGILDADRVRTAADDDAAGDLNAVERYLVRAVRDDEVAVDGHAGERRATLADDHVALDCLAGDALCADIGCRHAGDDLGEFRASDVVLQVQQAVRAVDIAACDQRRNALGRPRGYRAAVNKVLQRGAAAALERKGARQNGERLLAGDRCIRVQQAIRALERAHLDCLAHIAVIPCARQYVSVVVQRRRLSRAEGTGDDRRHLCAGQQSLRVDHTVRAVQQAIVDRLLERLRGPVVREILVLAQVGSKGIARQEHRACQHHCNGVFTLHFSIPPFVRQS